MTTLLGKVAEVTGIPMSTNIASFIIRSIASFDTTITINGIASCSLEVGSMSKRIGFFNVTVQESTLATRL